MTAGALEAVVAALERIARALEPAASASWPAGEGRAFSWDGDGGLRPVRRPAPAPPEVFAGVERQQAALYENVGRFLRGAPAHDVLLWGERGTGKSSLVRSLLSALEDPQLALVSVAEGDIPAVPRLLEALEADPRRWVLFFDDLSFRGPGDAYRELKVLLEGGLEARPENTLVIATANRRHLVPETFGAGDEVHPEEAVAEALSLADRFGLSLGFYPFDEPTYLDAVARHLRSLGFAPSDDAWRTEAVRWALARGLRSGRVARQAAVEIAGG